MSRTSTWNEGALAQVRAMRAEGLSFDVIGPRVGKCASAVRKAINRADGIGRRGREIYRDPYCNQDPRIATFAHLRDILKAHGYNAKWQSLNIGSDHLIRHMACQNLFPAYGPSSAASCEEYA